tara:strand:- start:593 stop:1483 length:891 start_codon:yes stop_codon:yes gene_type:complete
MIKKICPICETDKNSYLVYNEKLPQEKNQINFSGSKNPDGFHYKMVRCKNCDLLYAAEIYNENFSNELYQESDFVNSLEIDGLKKTYEKCISLALKNLESKSNFLEIGCGSGYMMEVALNLGFKNVEGVEPSKLAIDAANENIKKKIKHGVFNKNDFKENSYDLIFIAMIIEHVTDINNFLSNLYNILKPGGFIVCVCHNERHFLSKVLKSKHPIINDEHVYVFGKDTLSKIFSKNNFIDIKIENLKNFYTADYWFKMIPLPKFIKNPLKFIIKLVIKEKPIGIKAGNLYLIAKKG